MQLATRKTTAGNRAQLGVPDSSAINSPIDVRAPAKLNLFLEILGKGEDGFHELETVMVPVALHDRLSFVFRDDGQINFSLTIGAPPGNGDPSSMGTIPLDGRNLVVQALERLRTFSAQPERLGCDVVLEKNIPAESGMGGASSDAAATLLAGSRMWGLGLSPDQLHELAAELGSDVPFFLFGGAAVCRGRGEKVEPLESIASLPVVIAKPAIGLSTAEVYQRVKIPTQPLRADEWIQSVAAGGPEKIGDLMFNRLQEFASQMTDEIERISREFSNVHCLGHQMSGSGSSYFGVFATERVARSAAQALSARLPQVRIFCSKTLSRR